MSGNGQKRAGKVPAETVEGTLFPSPPERRGPNRREAERLVRGLRRSGELDDATRPLVELLRGLATAMDRELTGGTAWTQAAISRELRAVLEVLTARLRSTDSLDELLRALSTPVG